MKGTGEGIRRAALVAAILMAGWTLSLAVQEQAHSFLNWVNLPFHEAGHLFLLPFGRTLHLLGGTLFQLLIPAVLAGYFLIRQSPLSAAACLGWLGESFVNVSVYMADARELKLDLVGGGEHDWNEIFYRFGLLGQDSVARISAVTHHLGVGVMLASALWMACFALPAKTRERLRDQAASRFPPAGRFLERGE